MDFAMTYIFPPIMGLLSMLICVVIGALPSSFVEGGPKGVAWASLITIAITGSLYAWLGYMVWDITFYDSSEWPTSTGAYIGFAAAAICTAIAPVHTLLTGRSRAQFLRDMAPRVLLLAERYFAAIDSDGNGVITDEELKKALKGLGLDSEERAVLKHIKDELSEIGHVIRTYTTTTLVWTPIGKGGMMLPRTTTHNVYGISSQDLPGYPARVFEKYKHW